MLLLIVQLYTHYSHMHSLLYIWPNSKKNMDILEVIIRNEFNIVVITIIKRRSQIALSWNINYIIKKFYTSLRS